MTLAATAQRPRVRGRQSPSLDPSFNIGRLSPEENYHDAHEPFTAFYAPFRHSLWIMQESGNVPYPVHQIRHTEGGSLWKCAELSRRVPICARIAGHCVSNDAAARDSSSLLGPSCSFIAKEYSRDGWAAQLAGSATAGQKTEPNSGLVRRSRTFAA